MALDFPRNPTNGQTYAYGGKTWQWTGTIWAPVSNIGKRLDMVDAINEAPIVTLPSAATMAIGAAQANTIQVSGTTTITGFDAITAGAVRRLVFYGALTLTYNATSLILPGKANITTAAGDAATFVSLGGGNWRCVGYQLASSVGGGGGGGSGAITKYFESNPLTVTLSGKYTLAHGLSAIPKGVSAYILFSAQLNQFVAGDRLEMPAIVNGSYDAGSGQVPPQNISAVYYDSTNIYVNMPPIWRLPYKSSPGSQLTDVSNSVNSFQLIIRAFS